MKFKLYVAIQKSTNVRNENHKIFKKFCKIMHFQKVISLCEIMSV